MRSLALRLFLFVVAPCLLPLNGAAQALTGTVQNVSGEIVPFASVSLQSASGEVEASVRAERDGTFSLSVPGQGEFRIRADAPGHAPYESHLLALDGGRDYQLVLELERVFSDAMGVRVPRSRYQEWVDLRVPDRRVRDIVIVAAEQWREAVAGRDLMEALESAGFPRVSYQRTPDGFCARSGSSTGCMAITPYAHGAIPRLRDLDPTRIDGVVYIGPTVRSAPTSRSMGWTEQAVNASLHIFIDGYLARVP